MPKSDMHVNINDILLQPDPVEEMVVKLGLDFLDFCIDQLEDDCAVTASDMDLEINENKFKVSEGIVNPIQKVNLPTIDGTDC